MKKNLYFNGLAIMMAAIATMGFSSCNDEMEETVEAVDPAQTIVDNNDEGGDETPKVEVLMFDQEGYTDNVHIASDTSYIDVNFYYNSHIDEGTYLAVWNAPNEPSFFVKVTGQEDISKDHRTSTFNRYRVIPACISQVLAKGSYKFDMNPYVNTDEQLRTVDGRINSSKYFDKDNQTYHPVAYTVVDEQKLHADGSQYYELPIAQWKSPLVEDQLNENGSIDINLLDLTSTVTDYKVEFADSCGSFGLDKLLIHVGAGVHFRLDIGTKYFFVPYIEAFEAGVNGNMKTEIDASLSFKKEVKLWDTTKPVIHMGHIYTTFMIGIVPVTVDCSPTIDFVTKATTKGQLKLASHFDFNTDLNAGVGYKANGGWSNLSSASVEDHLKFSAPSFYGEVSANMGIMLNVPLLLWGVAGPKACAGPMIAGNFKGKLDMENQEISCEGKVDFNIGGKVGAELSLMGEKLAQWSTDLNLWHKDLWKDSWSAKCSDGQETSEMINAATEELLDGVIPAGTKFFYLSKNDFANNDCKFDQANNSILIRNSYCQSKFITPRMGQAFVYQEAGKESYAAFRIFKVLYDPSTNYYICNYENFK